MDRSSLSIRLNGGELFVHLEKASFSKELRDAIKAELPEMIVAPVTEERMAFLRSRRLVSTVFSTPYNKSCPLVVETSEGKDRSDSQISAALRGVITALRQAFPSSAKDKRSS